MPSVDPSSQQPAERDDLDDLFNYDASMDDVFKDTNSKSDVALKEPIGLKRKATDGRVDLGIDKEVKITKRRQPIAKLDEARILSNAGIPKLRKITKERLKFRGKGHEFSDVSRLLNIYQLWLDDLYPRAKFADGLAIIEKLGHKKMMQMKRKEWIDESKPRSSYDETPQSIEDTSRDTTKVAESGGTIIGGPVGDGMPQNREEAPAHLQESDGALQQPETSGIGDVEEDDLDALLAEDAAETATRARVSEDNDPTHDEYEDEMEAMANLDAMW